jgi:hypothetical protein
LRKIPYSEAMWKVFICGVVGMTFIAIGSQEPMDLRMQLFGGVLIVAATIILKNTSDPKGRN